MNTTLNGNRKSFICYPPYCEESINLDMVCTTAGETEIAPYTEYPPRKKEHPAAFRPVVEGRILPDFALVYITSGSGVFVVEDKQWQVKPGSLFLILPGVKHHYKPDFETGWHEYWVGFKGNFFNRIVKEKIIFADGVFFDIGLHNSILDLFNIIFDEVRAQRPLYQIKTCSAIFMLISEIATGISRKNQPDYHQQIVDGAKYYMEQNIYGKVDIRSITDKICVSPSQLYAIFKKYTAMTPHQYFIRLKIRRAEVMLEEGGMPVKYVADKLGFEDQYNFSRLFKQKTGLSPSKWRAYMYGEERAPG
jgi:AraC-like DNA-binding protein